MASKNLLIFTVLLRVLTLGALIASIVVMVTNQFRDVDGTKSTFKDLNTYRFVIAAAGLGCLYSLIQLPFAIYHAHEGKRLIKNDFLPNFDFYADKVVAFVLASAGGAGIAATYELKKVIKQFFEAFKGVPGVEEADESKNIKFLNNGYIACGLVLLGCAFMIFLSIISSLNKAKRSTFF